MFRLDSQYLNQNHSEMISEEAILVLGIIKRLLIMDRLSKPI